MRDGTSVYSSTSVDCLTAWQTYKGVALLSFYFDLHLFLQAQKTLAVIQTLCIFFLDIRKSTAQGNWRMRIL